jgi:hypothetical protein
MPNESRTLTEQRIRKVKALATTMRELQLAQLEGTLVPIAAVEATWAGAVIRMRDAMLAVPVKCASRFPDPRHAEAIIRDEVEIALRQLKGRT